MARGWADLTGIQTATAKQKGPAREPLVSETVWKLAVLYSMRLRWELLFLPFRFSATARLAFATQCYSSVSDAGGENNKAS